MMGYENTYRIPTIMMNVMNAFGERQHPEKFIGKAINAVLKGEVLKARSLPLPNGLCVTNATDPMK